MSDAIASIGLALTWIVATVGITIGWDDMVQAGRDARGRLRRRPVRPQLEGTVDLGPSLARARARVPARAPRRYPRQRHPRHLRP